MLVPAMSARNGDKSRFHRLRKAKIARRSRMRVVKQAAEPQKAAKHEGERTA